MAQTDALGTGWLNKDVALASQRAGELQAARSNSARPVTVVTVQMQSSQPSPPQQPPARQSGSIFRSVAITISATG